MMNSSMLRAAHKIISKPAVSRSQLPSASTCLASSQSSLIQHTQSRRCIMPTCGHQAHTMRIISSRSRSHNRPVLPTPLKRNRCHYQSQKAHEIVGHQPAMRHCKIDGVKAWFQPGVSMALYCMTGPLILVSTNVTPIDAAQCLFKPEALLVLAASGPAGPLAIH